MSKILENWSLTSGFPTRSDHPVLHQEKARSWKVLIEEVERL